MSSLLDILHRKDSRTEPDPVEPAADSATETIDAPIELPVELRLAVDNGPAETPAFDIPTAEIKVAPQAAAAPGPDPFATQLLTAGQLRQRSRRSGAWLGAGLLLIVLGAGVATWLLNEVRQDPAGSESLFTAPGAEVPAPPSAASEEPTVVNGPAKAEAPSAPSAPADPAASEDPTAEQPDTAWFDAPATEALAETPEELPAEPIRIVRGTTKNPLFPKLSEAWTAFQVADYVRAETLYRDVLTTEPGNLDALLGLGALAARGGRVDEAREMYQAVLLAEPKNAPAISALSTLPAAGTHPLDESGLKNLLREQPGAANLHFALGLKYVTQGRWPDAQTAFFAAVSNEPTNADYAYNLAVSLDQLGQAGPAAAYYQRALNLATASALFNPGVAQARLDTLRTGAAPVATPQAVAR